MFKNKYAFIFVIVNYIVLKKTIFDPMNLKFIVDQPTVPVVVYVVCKITSAVVLWKSEFSGGSNKEFYVQHWKISQSSHSMLSSSIPDPGVTADLQYTVNNLVPETLYIFQIITRNDYGDAFTKSVNCTTDHSMYDVVYILMEKRNCALLKTKLNINIKTKVVYCVKYIFKFYITQLEK
jgi:hypothetical protein